MVTKSPHRILTLTIHGSPLFPNIFPNIPPPVKGALQIGIPLSASIWNSSKSMLKIFKKKAVKVSVTKITFFFSYPVSKNTGDRAFSVHKIKMPTE